MSNSRETRTTLLLITIQDTTKAEEMLTPSSLMRTSTTSLDRVLTTHNRKRTNPEVMKMVPIVRPLLTKIFTVSFVSRKKPLKTEMLVI